MRTDYDLVAIGSGPAGQRAAVQAAKLGKRAAIVERDDVGGVSTNSGTVPSKTLRSAIAELSGTSGRRYRGPHEVTIDDLVWRTRQVLEHEREVIQDQLRRNGVEVLAGTASFLDPHTLVIRDALGSRCVRAERIVIAVGSTPRVLRASTSMAGRCSTPTACSGSTACPGR
jgi:NAD(P) transhydrogenase